jgi:hypothetical protein
MTFLIYASVRYNLIKAKFMFKKTWLYTLLLAPTLAACQPTNISKVVIPFSDEVRTVNGAYVTLEYNELSVMIEQEETFILMVGNASCGCTTEFLPVMRDWIEENSILTYYLEYTKLESATNKFEIPMVTGSIPVLAIFEEGELVFSKVYNPNRSSDNVLFYDLELLTAWFEERLIFPSFQFLSKANFDQLFTTNRKMIIYIGRRTCADCTYAFNTFVLPYIRNNPTLPTMYGIDVLDNNIWRPETANNTPGWSEFKTNYGMDNVLNTTFGYATGFVPTFMYIETNGQSIQANPSIIKDMMVTYNDSSLQDPTKSFNAETNPRTTSLSRTFFDRSRPLQYTTIDLRTLSLPPHQNSSELRAILEPHHNHAMLDFFTMYLPEVTSV